MAKRKAKRLLQMLADAKAAGWSKWIRTESDERALLDGCRFDESHALRVVKFGRTFCRHSKGRWADKPFEHLPWQYDRLTGPLFGWRRADGRRRFEHLFCTVAKKNGKSGYASMLGSYLTTADNEPGAQVYSVACDRSQAGIIYDEAANMLRPTLIASGDVEEIPSQKRLVYPAKNAFFCALSADVKSKEGVNPSAILGDEVHVWPNAAMFDTLRYAMDAREQPLFAMFTTAGASMESLWGEELKKARDIEAGKLVDLHYLPVIFEAAPDDPLDSEDTWRKANPSLGVTISIDRMRADYESAQKSPRAMRQFTRYKLNRMTQADGAMFDRDRWDALAGEIVDAAGEDIFLGVDLADMDDICALVRLWRRDGILYVRPKFWAPEATVEKREREGNTAYYDWVQQGHLITCPGEIMDQNLIKDEILAELNGGDLREVGYDPYQATKLATELADEGAEVVKVPPAMVHMAPPTHAIEAAITEGKLIHDGNPVMSWMIGNAVAFEDRHGRRMPSKKNSKEKIDGVSALVIALSRELVFSYTDGAPARGMFML